jgi:hypothetical protein
MIRMTDLSAIDRFIDMFGEDIYVFSTFSNSSMELYDLRYFLEDENTACSLDFFDAKVDGIYDKASGKKVVTIIQNDNYHRDDLNDI